MIEKYNVFGYIIDFSFRVNSFDVKDIPDDKSLKKSSSGCIGKGDVPLESHDEE